MVKKVTVHAANFEYKQIVVGFAGNARSLVITTPQNNHIPAPYSSLIELEAVSETNIKTISSSFGATALGAIAFGGAGMVAGAVMGGNKNEVTFNAIFDDGKKLLGSVDKKIFQDMQGALAQKSFAGEGLMRLDSNLPQPHEKKGGLIFWLAVLIAPLIFSWFTLQKKYTSTNRIIAFGWLAFCFVAVIAGKK